MLHSFGIRSLGLLSVLWAACASVGTADIRGDYLETRTCDCTRAPALPTDRLALLDNRRSWPGASMKAATKGSTSPA